MAQHILRESKLPAHPAKNPNDSYIMHLTLGLFVYARLQQSGMSSLRVQVDGSTALLSNGGGANVAKGSAEQMNELVGLINSMIDTNRSRASQLDQELTKLQSDLSFLSRRFSLALAAKKLARRCPLVRFF
jgi:hypothetical protein